MNGIFVECHAALGGQRNEQKRRLSPCCIDLRPLDALWIIRQASEAQSVDCRISAVIANREGIVVYICELESVELRSIMC